MQISFTKHPNVIVMHLMGDVDSTNYTNVVIQAQEVYKEGARNLLLDLTKVAYVSSAGLMAFHTLARIFSGHSIEGKDGGRPTFRAINVTPASARRSPPKPTKRQSGFCLRRA